jgi:hypothetical protein
MWVLIVDSSIDSVVAISAFERAGGHRLEHIAFARPECVQARVVRRVRPGLPRHPIDHAAGDRARPEPVPRAVVGLPPIAEEQATRIRRSAQSDPLSGSWTKGSTRHSPGRERALRTQRSRHDHFQAPSSRSSLPSSRRRTSLRRSIGSPLSSQARRRPSQPGPRVEREGRGRDSSRDDQDASTANEPLSRRAPALHRRVLRLCRHHMHGN